MGGGGGQGTNHPPPLQRRGDIFLNQQMMWCRFSLDGEEFSADELQHTWAE